jgi:hypothetical protein
MGFDHQIQGFPANWPKSSNSMTDLLEDWNNQWEFQDSRILKYL